MKRHRFAVAAALAIALGAVAPLAHAQPDWPAKPVRILVGFAPGGTTDITARMLAEQLTRDLKQPFLVENRAGAAGMIAAAEVARAAPDGYTLLMGNAGTQAINQFLYARMNYDSQRDFAPVSLVVRVPLVLVVTRSLGVRSLAELIDRARAKPGAILFGTAGPGTPGHLSTEMLKMRAGIDLVHVPYKGSGPMLQDLLGGQVQLAIDLVPPALPHIRSGRLVALGVTSADSIPVLPQVPPIASVLPGFSSDGWYALMAPAGTPERIVSKLAGGIDAVLHRPEERERFRQLGAEPVGGTPAALARFIEAEVTKWREVVKVSGARAD